MAAIVNDRDVMLQSAGTRIIPVQFPSQIVLPGYTGIALAATQNFFSVNAQNVATPDSIRITAVLKGVSGVVNWSIQGGSLSVPLGGSNLMRDLFASQMTLDNVTVTASITYNGVTYSDSMAFAKIRAGAPGTSGQRGTAFVVTNVPGGFWFDGYADDALAAMTGSSTKIVGDAVTEQYQVNGSNEWVQTRAWTGFAWSIVNEVVDGNLLVRASVIADAMHANSITAWNGAIENLTVSSAKIAQQIQSDVFIFPGQGWGINKDGSAAFQNVAINGYVQSGTRIRDRTSNEWMYATAMVHNDGQSIPDTSGGPVLPSGMAMYGPNSHGSVAIGQRIRAAPSDNPITIQISCSVICDHYFSLYWTQIDSQFGSGGWQPLAVTISPESGDGTATLVAAISRPMSDDGIIGFGVRGSDTAGNFFDPGKTYLTAPFMTAIAINV
jgi:hypothetical protein